MLSDHPWQRKLMLNLMIILMICKFSNFDRNSFESDSSKTSQEYFSNVASEKYPDERTILWTINYGYAA